MLPKRWKIHSPDPQAVNRLERGFGLRRATATVLCNRGILPEQVRAFFQPRLRELADPFELPGMERAVERIWQAVTNEEKILIHGDFDIDGISATALLSWVLRANRARTDSFLPHRLEEGYGLSIESLDKAVRDQTLLITVDCGITGLEGARYAKERGLDLIISDHHEPGEELPEALAIIDPKLHPELEHLQALAGVGVCFKLCHAFLKYGREHQLGGVGPDLKEGMDLVALGTVADIVPLTGENRCLVRHGMAVLAMQQRPGVHALCEIAGIRNQLNAEDIAFRLAPRLNAAGRMGEAGDALELLECDNIVAAHDLARKLDNYNRQRQDLEEETYQAAREQINRFKLLERSAIVVHGDKWHRGVIGIVASRLAQEFNRPSIVLTRDEDGALQGSGRSIADLNLIEALDRCGDCLKSYGGHLMAVGLTLEGDRFDDFQSRFEAAVKPEATGDGSGVSVLPIMELEGELEIGELDEQFFRELELLRPFGQENPPPAFRFSRVYADRLLPAGTNNSRGLLVDESARKINFICFGRVPGEFPQGLWDIAGTPALNLYTGIATPQIRILDVRPAGQP